MEKVTLVCLRGSRSGDRFDIGTLASPAVLGRDLDSVVPLHPELDALASTRHVELRRDGDGVLVTDLGSTNGTWIGPLGAARRIERAATVPSGTIVALGKDGPAFRVSFGEEVRPGVRTSIPATAIAPEIEPASGRAGVHRAPIAEAIRRSSRPLWWLVSLQLLLSGGAAVGFWYYAQHQTENHAEAANALSRESLAIRETLTTEVTTLRAELGATQRDLAGTKDKLGLAETALTSARDRLADTSSKLTEVALALQTADGSSKKQLEAQAAALQTLKAEHESDLGRTAAEFAKIRAKEQAAEAIVKKYELSLFMLIVVTPRGDLEGFCTAFAVDASGILATNAHCLDVIEEATHNGQTVVARMNRRPDRSYKVLKWRKHRRYDGSAFSDDVGLARVDLRGATLPAVTPVAAWIDLIALSGGQPIYTIGFPGKVMNPAAPVADLRAAVVSRVTDFTNAPGLPGDNRMVWHSALTTKGTSGSPIFNAFGQVVAVNNGVLSARKVMVPSDNGGIHEEIAYDANGLNFGVRADALTELIDAGCP